MTRLLRWLAFALGLGALAVLGMWLVGRLANDRTLATQFVGWIPTWMLAAVGAMLLALWACAVKAFRVASRRPASAEGRTIRTPARRSARTALVLLLAALFWLVFVDLRVQNRYRRSPADAGLNITHWNASGADRDRIVGPLQHTEADLTILVNAGGPTGLAEYLGTLRGKDREPSVVRFDRFLVVSRYPITRWAFTELGVEPASTRLFEAAGVQKDPGRALFLEIDASAVMPRPIRVWVLDLPSDPNLHRLRVAQDAARRLRYFQGASRRRQPNGMDADEPMAGGFPLPDIIVGDFNIPRGSVSLGLIAQGMANAFDQAGHGLVATYPRQRPILHLDQMFIGPDHRAVRYDVRDGGSGYHRLQTARVIARPVGAPK
jgi:hypothetical protein